MNQVHREAHHPSAAPKVSIKIMTQPVAQCTAAIDFLCRARMKKLDELSFVRNQLA
jgi:hypothetical protein